MPELEILRRRFSNQHLARPRETDSVRVVAALGAVQAQDYPAAKWALAMRLTGATDATLEAAFNAGAILRTHVLRPTWHFVAPADIRWMLALTGPRVKRILERNGALWGVDADKLRRGHAALARALQGGQQLTRAQIDTVLLASGIQLGGEGLGYVAMHAELDGLICSGPRRGKQFTYMLLDERVPPAPALTRDEAVGELVRRYFTSHGPAQPQDFAWWSGLTLGDTRQGLALAGDRLRREGVDGQDFYFAEGAPAPLPTGAYLLPNYDEYTVAYKDRSHFHNADDFQSPNARDNVPFANMIVLGGWVMGTWKRTLGSKTVQVAAHWLRPPSAAQQRALEAAIQRYGAFLGLEAQALT
jgi:hypothetical protein